jgi:hypothetical protein
VLVVAQHQRYAHELDVQLLQAQPAVGTLLWRSRTVINRGRSLVGYASCSASCSMADANLELIIASSDCLVQGTMCLG